MKIGVTRSNFPCYLNWKLYFGQRADAARAESLANLFSVLVDSNFLQVGFKRPLGRFL